MKNQEVAKIFREIAKILELKEDNPFRIRAYEKAAYNIESLGEDLETLAKEDKLTKISGIGEDLASKIKEILDTGTLKYYEELKSQTPAGLLKMMEIPALGPKTIKKIYDKLKIDTIEKLEEAAKNHLLSNIEGIREKTEENILRGIELIKKGLERTPLYNALLIANRFLEELKKLKEVEKIEVAGSLRRKKETIRDIDILIVSKKPSVVMERFVSLDSADKILAQGSTKSSIISKENIQVDLRVIEDKSFGSALMYFTGSKEFNIKIRQLAIKNNLKISEYGVFKNEKWIAGRTEEEIFSILGLSYIEPELREDRGEIELALLNKLPKIVKLEDIKGDLHVHSNYSDGFLSLQEIYNEALRLNYSYIGICDHSQGLKVAKGLSKDALYRKKEEIEKINKKGKLRLLFGTEVDIDSSGNLDYPDSILKEFDLVIAAIHTGFKQSKSQLTKRIINACKNKYVNIIAHPTGRLFKTREPYEIDLKEILKVCSDYNVALEINCYPDRLDINDLGALEAKKANVKLSLGTDTHNKEHLNAIELGLAIARRGWLEKNDLLNCMDIDTLIKWLKK